MSWRTCRSSSMHRISSRPTPGMGVKAGRIDGETGVVGGQIDLADEGVRRFDVGYAGERELVDQPILKRPERALRCAPAPAANRP